MRMPPMTTNTSRPHIRKPDIEYHELVGAYMGTVHMKRYKRQHIYHYGRVSLLKLLDEGCVTMEPNHALARDLEIYREALDLLKQDAAQSGGAQ